MKTKYILRIPDLDDFEVTLDIYYEPDTILTMHGYDEDLIVVKKEDILYLVPIIKPFKKGIKASEYSFTVASNRKFLFGTDNLYKWDINTGKY